MRRQRLSSMAWLAMGVDRPACAAAGAGAGSLINDDEILPPLPRLVISANGAFPHIGGVVSLPPPAFTVVEANDYRVDLVRAVVTRPPSDEEGNRPGSPAAAAGELFCRLALTLTLTLSTLTLASSPPAVLRRERLHRASAAHNKTLPAHRRRGYAGGFPAPASPPATVTICRRLARAIIISVTVAFTRYLCRPSW